MKCLRKKKIIQKQTNKDVKWCTCSSSCTVWPASLFVGEIHILPGDKFRVKRTEEAHVSLVCYGYYMIQKDHKFECWVAVDHMIVTHLKIKV